MINEIPPHPFESTSASRSNMKQKIYRERVFSRIRLLWSMKDTVDIIHWVLWKWENTGRGEPTQPGLKSHFCSLLITYKHITHHMSSVSYTTVTCILFTKPVEAQDCCWWEHSTHRTRHLEKKENECMIGNTLYKKVEVIEERFFLQSYSSVKLNTSVEGKCQSAPWNL